MSSESNTERLIDLMFGESTDQEKENFLEEIAESSALQRERAEIRTLMGDVSDVWPDQPVSASLHNSIMDAAKSAVNERAEKKQYVTPIKPPGLWSRLKSSGQIGQIAMVATVVIAGAFVFRFVNFDDKASVHEEMAVTLPEKNGTLPKLAAKPQPTEVSEAKEMTDEVTDKKTEIAEKGADSAREQEKEAIALKKKVTKAPRQKKDAKRTAGRPKTKKSVSKKESSNKKVNIGSSSKGAAPRGVVQNKEYFDDLNSGSAQQNETDSYQKRAENAEELKLVPAKTIDSVSSKYNARDYSGTIQAADEFVGLKSGTRTEHARALQLKAQSLANLGRYTEALRVYDSILKNYKTYQSAAISSARAEISRKLEERKPAKQKRKAAEKSYDFEDSPSESQQK